MQHLPLFADLQHRRCLVVGGGEVAERKVAMLRRAASDLVVVAPKLTDQLRRWVESGTLQWVARAVAESDLDGVHLVIAASDNAQVNAAVAEAARVRHCLINVVDQPQLSNFISPAVVDRSPLVIAISSGGAMPVLARRVRAWLDVLLPTGIGRLAATAGRWRAQVAERIPDLRPRRHFWEQILDRALESPADPERLIKSALTTQTAAPGRVFLVGAGPGDPDLLTLKAARLLQQADVILYDRLVAPEILERARRDAQFIDVGKKAGAHRFSQAQINQLLIRHARRGQLVCRLKGGDPGLFGRAAEEIAALRHAGIEVQLVPGITAAQGCAAASGFSLTDRHHAHSLLLATGHAADDAELAAIPPADAQTQVFYMPVKALPELRQRLLDQGVDGAMPCALIENGTRPQQRVIRSDLRYIDTAALRADIQSPALLVVGRVVEAIAPGVLAGTASTQSADAITFGRAVNAA